MQGQEYCKKEEGDFLLISFAANQYLNRQRKYLTNDKAVINNDGKVNSSSKTSSKFHCSDFEFSSVLLTVIQTVGIKALLAHIKEAERCETPEYKTHDLTSEPSRSYTLGNDGPVPDEVPRRTTLYVEWHERDRTVPVSNRLLLGQRRCNCDGRRTHIHAGRNGRVRPGRG